MSKLDEILSNVITEEMAKKYLTDTEGYPGDAEEKHYFNTEAGKEYQTMLVNRAKQAIKDLFLELIGEPDERYKGDNDGYGWRNDLRAELRKKVEEL